MKRRNLHVLNTQIVRRHCLTDGTAVAQNFSGPTAAFTAVFYGMEGLNRERPLSSHMEHYVDLRRMVTRWVWLISIALLAMGLTLGSANQGLTAPRFSAPDHKPLPTAAPTVGTKQRGLSLANAEASRRVYELMPELPLENQYISSVSGDVAVNNTLVSRLINYHTFVKGRTPIFRLDWKLTLADFIGVNERINIETYPGSDTLTANPAESDIAIIQGLNRAQREQLIDALVSIFTPDASSQPAPEPLPSPVAPQAPDPTPGSSTSPLQPRPGDAQLLLP